MRKPEFVTRKRSGLLRRYDQLGYLHRWFGLASLLFILILSLTGIALNHTIDFGLDERFIDSPWLLNWYGFDAPEPSASYAVDAHRVTLVGNRLYLNSLEASRGISRLTGAVFWDQLIVVATAESLLYLSPTEGLVDRLDVRSELPGSIDGLTAHAAGLVIRSADRLFAYDEQRLEVSVFDRDPKEFDWLAPSDVPEALIEQINLQYRGPGVTVERLLYDVHSGRVFTRAGPLLMDIVGLLLIALTGTGLALWFKRRS